jgi:hypothetical protein
MINTRFNNQPSFVTISVHVFENHKPFLCCLFSDITAMCATVLSKIPSTSWTTSMAKSVSTQLAAHRE